MWFLNYLNYLIHKPFIVPLSLHFHPFSFMQPSFLITLQSTVLSPAGNAVTLHSPRSQSPLHWGFFSFLQCSSAILSLASCRASFSVQPSPSPLTPAMDGPL